MKRLSRYIFQQLVIGMLLVTAGLACIIWLVQSLRFVEMIVNRGLSAGTFVYLTVLVLPNTFPLVLPVALFAIVVFVYSKMITDRELVVMRCTGMSQSALAKPALLLALIVTVVTYAINLFVIPESWRTFREMQWQFRYSLSHIVLEEGAFNSLGEDLTVYLRERSPDAQLEGLLVHDNRDREKPTTYMAERGALVETKDGARLVLFDGNRQEMERKTGRLTMLYYDRSTVDLGDIVKSPGIRYREARERTLDELLNAATDPTVAEQDLGKFTMEAHNRLATPLLALSFTVVGLACLLSGAFTRRSQTKRVFLAIFLLVGLQAGTLSLQYFCARHLEYVPLLYVNSLVPMFIGFVAMLRATDWRRRRAAPVTP
jgi:lipopolysaccharide export system permease protein